MEGEAAKGDKNKQKTQGGQGKKGGGKNKDGGAA